MLFFPDDGTLKLIPKESLKGNYEDLQLAKELTFADFWYMILVNPEIKESKMFKRLLERNRLPLITDLRRDSYIPTFCVRCGNVFGAYGYDHLRRGECDCLKEDKNMSAGSNIIFKILDSLKAMKVIDFDREWTHPNLRGEKGGYLRVDYVLYKYGTRNIIGFIEYDGVQHYKFSSHFHENEEEFKRRQRDDNNKTEFCNSIAPLLRILDKSTLKRKQEEIKKELEPFLEEILSLNKKIEISF